MLNSGNDIRGAFGFCYFEGRITKHPIEFPVLRVIHGRWSRGTSVHYITCELNKKKMKPRAGRQWSWAAVRNIVARFDRVNLLLFAEEQTPHRTRRADFPQRALQYLIQFI